MRSTNFAALNAADATQASVSSGPIDASSMTAVSCVAIAAGGTITGTLKFQVSNDAPGGNPSTVANWVDCAQSVSITGAGNFLIPKFDVAYQWIQLVYTKTTSAAGAKITALIKSDGY